MAIKYVNVRLEDTVQQRFRKEADKYDLAYSKLLMELLPFYRLLRKLKKLAAKEGKTVEQFINDLLLKK